jgi:hypothetical protein
MLIFLNQILFSNSLNLNQKDLLIIQNKDDSFQLLQNSNLNFYNFVYLPIFASDFNKKYIIFTKIDSFMEQNGFYRKESIMTAYKTGEALYARK